MSHESQIAKSVVFHKHEEGISKVSNDAWSKQTGSDTSQITHAKTKGNGEDLLPKMQITMSGDDGGTKGKHSDSSDRDEKTKQLNKESDIREAAKHNGVTDGGEKAKQAGTDGGQKEKHVGYTDAGEKAKQLTSNVKEQFDK